MVEQIGFSELSSFLFHLQQKAKEATATTNEQQTEAADSGL